MSVHWQVSGVLYHVATSIIFTDMKKLFSLLLLASLLSLVSAPLYSQDMPVYTLEDLERDIEQTVENFGISGLSLVLVDENGPIWSHSQGVSNIAKQHPMSADTLFRMNGISSIFISFAVMKLVEEGKLDLSANLRELAPELKFHNPWQQSHPVKLMHLLEHTAGWDGLHFAEHYLRDNIKELGQAPLLERLNHYSRSRTSRWPPGTRRSPSTGPVAAAYIVEKVSGVPFQSYIAKHFFEALGLDSSRYTKPVNVDRRLASAHALGPEHDWHDLIYPEMRGLMISTADAAKVLGFLLQRGSLGDNRILNPASISRIETNRSTLGSQDGRVVNHGMAVATSGLYNTGALFHGTKTSNIEITYSNTLKKGYFIAGTSGNKGIRSLARSIKRYLVGDRINQEFSGKTIPPELHNIQGYYRRISGFNERRRFLADLFSMLRIERFESHIERAPILGEYRSKEYYAGNGRFISSWVGLPVTTPVQDPIAGPSVQAWVLLKKIHPFWVYSKLLFFSLYSLCVVLSLLFCLYILVTLLTQKPRLAYPSFFKMNLLPGLGSACLTVCFVLFLFFGHPHALGAPTLVSLSIMAASGFFAAIAVVSCLYCAYHFKLQRAQAYYWTTLCVSSFHLLSTLYFASYGLIGMRTWTM